MCKSGSKMISELELLYLDAKIQKSTRGQKSITINEILAASNDSSDFCTPRLIVLSPTPDQIQTLSWLIKLVLEWLHETFTPAARKYLSDNHLLERCLLLMDNAPTHPPGLVDHMDNEYDFIEITFLSPNTTPILQSMDQQVISNLKKLYTKGLFTRCFNVIEQTSLTLREFWKNHFNIVHCINLIDKAWEDITYRTLNLALKKLWPECVAE